MSHFFFKNLPNAGVDLLAKFETFHTRATTIEIKIRRTRSVSGFPVFSVNVCEVCVCCISR